jgi:putative hydrolases of HD superfamily
MNLDSALKSLQFVEEIDRLKGILRQTLLYDGSRRENTAEHSWHLAMAVLVLAPLAEEKLDLARALKMALVHDVVEIDAGDTFVYDAVASLDKQAREEAAAERIFGLLPAPLNAELRSIWTEFEQLSCPESRFVAGLDRLLPLIANSKTEGHSWKKHGIVKSQVLDKNRKIEAASKTLWDLAERLVEDAVRKGHLSEG